jgi:mRNA interferase MazF
MGIEIHPEIGTILRVDLSEGFRVPEMRKRRPAVVISPQLADREQLCTIVPLSTNKPRKLQPYNLELHLDPPLPFPFENPVMWVKADMILTVAFHRLALLHLKSRAQNGERQYDVRVLDAEKMAEIHACIRFALGM